MGKKRLDILIFEKNISPSREKAKSLILEGVVLVNGEKILKPSFLVNEECKIEILENDTLKFVSRGGLKLEKAFKSFDLNVKNLICMDIGASTGGFTQVLLDKGCKKVYAVDVGKLQLHDSLKNNSKVINMENTNIRDIDESVINNSIDFFTVDVSFTSLTLVLPKIKKLISKNAQGICLIKPQFEAGRENIGKNGIVKDLNVHIKVIKKICDSCMALNFSVLGIVHSPIKGSQGNIEYLIYIKNSKKMNMVLDIKKLVKISHEALK